ncbi:flavin-containing monooxygenase [Streptomyces sp. NPDC057638]|uniref:flavin-containing monooxygenase n=1 Tax=Streptomyces sp. NPDC057638 TaxID=3346190 RepID=UPI0036802D05
MTDRADVVVIGGGQSGLAAAYALLRRGLRPVVLEASQRMAGSWPRYYDSLVLFSPVWYNSLPGLPFDGDPDHYPRRDEVVSYLSAYAARLDADLRTGHRVRAVRRAGPGSGTGPGFGSGPGFEVETEEGDPVLARAVVAASGSFGRPHRPGLPGLTGFTGTVLHAAEYRVPAPFAGQRVIVVGAGNSALQIAVELSAVARVTLATRAPIQYAPQCVLGRDLHFWLARLGFDRAPLGRVLRNPPTPPVIDDGRYRAAVTRGEPDQRPLFTGADGTKVTWADGTREEVDTIVLATGYRPDLPYLAALDGALAPDGRPRQRGGIALAHPELAYVGLEWQHSATSNSLRGSGRDATRIARRLAARLRRH